MNTHEIIALNNARTTFQRIGDAKFFNGWIKRITPDSLVVHSCTHAQPAPGEEFAFQVYGSRQDSFFRARLTTLNAAEPPPAFVAERVPLVTTYEFHCEMTTEMSFMDSQGQPRFCVEGVTADLEIMPEIGAEGLLVIDIGPGGFAVLTDMPLGKGDAVGVKLYTQTQLVQCTAEVRNCITNSLNREYRRIGLQITGMDRVDALRWRQLYSTILDANRMLASRQRSEAHRARAKTSV